MPILRFFGGTQGWDTTLGHKAIKTNHQNDRIFGPNLSKKEGGQPCDTSNFLGHLLFEHFDAICPFTFFANFTKMNNPMTLTNTTT